MHELSSLVHMISVKSGSSRWSIPTACSLYVQVCSCIMNEINLIKKHLYNKGQGSLIHWSILAGMSLY